ncbi:hypothetical protein MUCCIDRAFT_155753 [Mucor lusitanicus CBS 277.49]|uniref:Uncharacterized protein n=2 Tax=Mucor circinelloides f. lusitanicus TaxID=29924 RepID=A0A168MGH3_MUCCL|nr:hypothetical protein MUCCIDRAFT_155753 [Mucor lusitanicus CBS 277.49]
MTTGIWAIPWFGEVKFGGDNTTNHSLCLDTLKLAVLSRNSVLEYDLPSLIHHTEKYPYVIAPVSTPSPHNIFSLCKSPYHTIISDDQQYHLEVS